MIPAPLATHDRYVTPAPRRIRSVCLSTLIFYPRMIRSVFAGARIAKRGRYDGEAWSASSRSILMALERAGCRFEVEGMQKYAGIEGPVVFVGNHMSTLETFILPALINPVKPVTFVVKSSLVDYPVFGAIMRSRNPIVVTRDNPRQDLQIVLEQGREKLASGMSLVLFPQTTRTTVFDPERFNSLGVKLARSAGVPVLPVALRTDAWANGTLIKEFGPIDPKKRVHIAFGEPMTVHGNGREEHERVTAFISSMLARWAEPT
jgi:1-acyl-sn-glycerol-3-phosphate acyltransferase